MMQLVSTNRKKAMVPMTPGVWYAWLKSFMSGYFAAASITTHQPLKNWNKKCYWSENIQQIYYMLWLELQY